MTERQSETGRRALQCRYCRKTHQKKDHLVRHERTHTGHKPFACKLCERTFSRQDSLFRHQRLHSTRGASTPGTEQVDTAHHAFDEPPPSNAAAEHDDDLDEPLAETDFFSINSDGMPIFAEAEDLYQYLLSTPPGWPRSLPADISPAYFSDNNKLSEPAGDQACTLNVVDNGSLPVVQQMNTMITKASSTITKEISARGITSSFIDACLHQFFARFNPTFPILHEPTFVLEECGAFLLLNMVAVGSLFFGSSETIAKGEFLWRLTQTAAATSWSNVLDGKAGHYRSQAAQIVTTALLGQTYAMLSKSKTIRTLCQALHGLALSWGRQFGLYDLPDFSRNDIPSLSANAEEKTMKWKSWATTEVQRRTMLGLYIVDAQLARYAGAVPIGKHVTNPLKLASQDCIFAASTADEWVREMNDNWRTPTTFRELFLLAFDPDPRPTPTLSQLSLSVLLEGFQAILSEYGDSNGFALGTPQMPQIIDASLRLHDSYFKAHSSSIEHLEHLLRWHTLCLDIATDTVLLSQRLCDIVGVEQNIFSTGRQSPDPIDLVAWACTEDARRALLHAFAIQDLAQSLTLGRAYPAHLPASLFSAATIYLAFVKFGCPSITPPKISDWKAVWGRPQIDQHNANSSSLLIANDSYRFVKDGTVTDGTNRSCNLRYSLLTLQLILQTVSSQWGVAHEMLNILSSWMASLD